MKVLLAAVNAKYIHSNLGVYSLKAYGENRVPGLKAEIGEYTINHRMDLVLQDIYLKKPDFIGFSCYIWNIKYVEELAEDLSRLLPKTRIWLGGPEASYRAEELLRLHPWAEGVMVGEGEKTFAELMTALGAGENGRAAEPGAGREEENGWEKDSRAAGHDAGREEESGRGKSPLEQVRGIVFRREDGAIVRTRPQEILDMDEIPFSYGDLDGFENRIIYYESSRGCPFSCSYCLSSIDKSVRFRSLWLVEDELGRFLEKKVPQVKFVDRTFNCRKSHSMAVWKYISEHDNGVTNFHFEISADLLDEEELALLGQMRPGLVQLEIGVQSTNPDTIREIRRKMDLKKLEAAVRTVNGFHNIHQHLDLIAGLPWEDYDSFHRSFDDVYRMEPDQLQLGFLKVLSGSYMAEAAESYGLIWSSSPPYEVLSTKWLPYEDVIRLKGVEEMVEVYYNSRQFTVTMETLAEELGSPFVLFERLARYYEEKGLMGMSHSRLARYEILYRFILENGLEKTGADGICYRDRLMKDLYLRENAKSRPFFAPDLSRYKEELRPFYGSRERRKNIHAEVLGNGAVLVFDYEKRDPLTHNASVETAGWLKADETAGRQE